jgi:hypothetical protein
MRRIRNITEICLVRGIQMEYEVVAEENLDALKREVKEFIADGFKPTGGIQVVLGTESMYFYQAMVKLDII